MRQLCVTQAGVPWVTISRDGETLKDASRKVFILSVFYFCYFGETYFYLDILYYHFRDDLDMFC